MHQGDLFHGLTAAGPGQRRLVRQQASLVTHNTSVALAGAAAVAAAVSAALADGLSPAGAAARANAAAAFAVTRHGPATAPDRAQLDAWLSDR